MARATLDPDRRFATIHPRRPIRIGPEFRQKTGTGGRGKAVILWDFRAVCLNLPYLRHRGVEIGPYKKPAEKSEPRRPSRPAPDANNETRTAIVLLSLRVENNSKFVRGKKKVLESIEHHHLRHYNVKRHPSGDYELKVTYQTDAELDERMEDLLREIGREADLRNCFAETDARLEGSDHHW
jgi:hypothetical protein